jgi:hypothetical protein
MVFAPRLRTYGGPGDLAESIMIMPGSLLPALMLHLLEVGEYARRLVHESSSANTMCACDWALFRQETLRCCEFGPFCVRAQTERHKLLVVLSGQCRLAQPLSGLRCACKGAVTVGIEAK